MAMDARSTFAVRTSQDHPPEGEKPQRGATRLIGPANSILRHNHGYNVYPASGHGAEQLMLQLGLAFAFPIADDTDSNVVEQVLMDADLFVVLLEDQEVEIISDEVRSTILVRAVSHVLQENTLPPVVNSSTRERKGKSTTRAQTSFGLANELSVHQRLSREYPQQLQAIQTLDSHSTRHGCTDCPMHAMALLPPVEDVLRKEGFVLEPYGHCLTRQTVEIGTLQIDLAAVLRWAFPGRDLSIQSWRQNRSSLQRAAKESNWSAYLDTIREALTHWLDPPVGILATLTSIEEAIEEFSIILHQSSAVLSLDSSNASEQQQAALGYSWRKFRTRRAILNRLQQLSAHAELFIAPHSASARPPEPVLYQQLRDFAQELLASAS